MWLGFWIIVLLIPVLNSALDAKLQGLRSKGCRRLDQTRARIHAMRVERPRTDACTRAHTKGSGVYQSFGRGICLL
jgi:hypothetical protein